MSSRVGTAIPPSRSTALSSTAVGFTRSIQTAFSGSAARSGSATFLSEDSAGTYTDSMEAPGLGGRPTQQDLARFWQAPDDAGGLTADPYLWRLNGSRVALIRRRRHLCPKMSRKPDQLRQKRHSQPAAARHRHLSSGIMTGFNDNGLNGIVAPGAQS